MYLYIHIVFFLSFGCEGPERRTAGGRPPAGSACLRAPSFPQSHCTTLGPAHLAPRPPSGRGASRLRSRLRSGLKCSAKPWKPPAVGFFPEFPPSLIATATEYQHIFSFPPPKVFKTNNEHRAAVVVLLCLFASKTTPGEEFGLFRFSHLETKYM